MHKFYKEFKTLNFVLKESKKILFFVHSRPDGDTIGASLALAEYAKKMGKTVDIACFDPFPEYLRVFSSAVFSFPSEIQIKKYDVIVASDSVERGFEKIKGKIRENQIVAILDHHPDIKMQADIKIIDPGYSSVCELVYDFFETNAVEITRKISTFLLLGILADTGVFQHSNTTPRVMEISSRLMKLGAPMNRLIEATFSNKKIATLKLWGKAFEKAKINSKNGMIFSVLTQKEIEDCGANSEDISRVSEILNSVPGTKFALVLSERQGGVIKGSLRSEKYKGVDVSSIAAQFGGGGHKLASGFELKGKIVELEDGWKVV